MEFSFFYERRFEKIKSIDFDDENMQKNFRGIKDIERLMCVYVKNLEFFTPVKVYTVSFWSWKLLL